MAKTLYESDEMVQTWMVHNLQIIGEASRNMSDEFRRAHPKLPWPLIVGMRNILVHEYQNVDLDLVWSTIERDLPQIQMELKKMLPKASDEGSRAGGEP